MDARDFMSDEFSKRFKPGIELNDFLWQVQKCGIEKMPEGKPPIETSRMNLIGLFEFPLEMLRGKSQQEMNNANQRPGSGLKSVLLTSKERGKPNASPSKFQLHTLCNSVERVLFGSLFDLFCYYHYP